MAALGLACGRGLLLEAAATMALVLTTVVILRFVERFFWRRKQEAQHHICIEATAIAGPLIGEIYDTCARIGVRIGTLGRTLGELQMLAEGQAVHADLPAGSRARDGMVHLDKEAFQEYTVARGSG